MFRVCTPLRACLIADTAPDASRLFDTLKPIILFEYASVTNDKYIGLALVPISVMSDTQTCQAY